MRNLIVGIFIGLVLGGGAVHAALSPHLQVNEYNKFIADDNGNVAVRIIFTE